MSQSRLKVGRAVLRLKKTGYKTVRSSWKRSEIYRFRRSATQNFSHLLKNSIWIVLYEICSIFSIWKIVLYEIHYYANPILHFCDWFMVIAIKFRHEVLHFLMCVIPWASENYHQRYFKSIDMDGWWTIACWQNRAIYASSFFFNVKIDVLKPPLVYDRLSPVFQRPWFL